MMDWWSWLSFSIGILAGIGLSMGFVLFVLVMGRKEFGSLRRQDL